MDRGAETPRIERTERFPGSSRVKARSEFVRLQSSSRRVHTPHFVVLLGVRDERREASSTGPRIGITVTRKIGCSVERNRVRRLVREVFRKNVELFPADHDIVVIARAGAPGLDYATVLAEVEGARGAMRAVAERNRRSPAGSR